MTRLDLSPPPRGPSRSLVLAASLLAAATACGPAADPGPTPIAKTAPPAPIAPAPTPTPASPVTPPAAPPPAAPAPPPGPLRAQDPGAYRPCELAIETCTQQGKPCVDPHPCAIHLIHLIPEGEPLHLTLSEPGTLRWRYAADERVLAGPTYVYRHTGATTGFRARADGSGETPVVFDERGRLRQIGDGQRLEYTPDGRAAGTSARSRGKWKQLVTYTWAANHTYAVNWTYPDAHEFCEPEPGAVDVDAQAA